MRRLLIYPGAPVKGKSTIRLIGKPWLTDQSQR